MRPMSACFQRDTGSCATVLRRSEPTRHSVGERRQSRRLLGAIRAERAQQVEQSSCARHTTLPPGDGCEDGNGHSRVYAAALNRTHFEELTAWQLVLPRTAAFSHLTAARLRGWWRPATIAHPVFAAMLDADPRPRRPGLLVCRHTQPFPMNLINGLRITTAAETILAAARDLGVLDLSSSVTRHSGCATAP